MSGIEDLLGKDLLGQINNGNDEAQGETEIKDPEQEEYVKRKIPNDQKKESE